LEIGRGQGKLPTDFWFKMAAGWWFPKLSHSALLIETIGETECLDWKYNLVTESATIHSDYGVDGSGLRIAYLGSSM